MVHGYAKNCDDATQISELGHVGVERKKGQKLNARKGQCLKRREIKEVGRTPKKCRVGGEIIAEAGGADAWRG